MTDRRPRVLVAGDVIDDVLVLPSGPIVVDGDTLARIERRPGGSGANTACWFAAAGADPVFVGTVQHGDVDRHADLLRAAGVDARLRSSATATGAIVLISDGTIRTMLTSRGASAETPPAALSDALLDEVQHLHCSGHLFFPADRDDAWRERLDAAAARGVTLSVDPGSAAFLARFGGWRFLRLVAGADVLVTSRDEAEVLIGERDPLEAARVLAGLHPLVVVTCGADGAVAAGGGEEIVQPAPAVSALDVTGAGDAFAAGLVAARLGGADLAEAMAAGAALAGRAVGIVGARPA